MLSERRTRSISHQFNIKISREWVTTMSLIDMYKKADAQKGNGDKFFSGWAQVDITSIFNNCIDKISNEHHQ